MQVRYPPAGLAPAAIRQPGANPNVRFGLPGPAEASLKSRDAYRIERP